MNKIEQLELAIKIIKAKEAGTPIKWERKKHGDWTQPTETCSPAWAVTNGFEIRIKPWKLGREINGHVLPDGKEWSASADDPWTEEDLPPPWRPAMVGEVGPFESQWKGVVSGAISWRTASLDENAPVPAGRKYRTTRPIPKPSILTDEQKAAGWIEWHGGENPIPGKQCEVLLKRAYARTTRSENWSWTHHGNYADIIAYRVVQPEYVDLGPEDFPPGSVLNSGADTSVPWMMVTNIDSNGVCFGWNEGIHSKSYSALHYEGWKANRSLAAGKWNPNAGEPCRKEKV